MKLSDATQDLQLLSNIGDLAVAGTGAGGSAVTSAAVKVKVFSTTIFDETMYAEDGTVWIRDMRGLLLPYMTPGIISLISVVVGTVTTSFSVMYCLAELQKESTDSNVTVLENNFLVSATKKTTLMSAQELLPFYCNSAATKQFGIKAVYSVNGSAPDTISLTKSKSANAGVNTVDVSPSVILDAIADEIDAESYEVNLYGYQVALTSADYTAEMIYKVEQHDDGRFIQMKYLNVWGVEETAIARMSDECDRKYDITNAYIASRLQRIDSSLTKAHVATLPLATDCDQAVAEAIVSSPTVQVMTSVNSWRDITITGADQTSNSQLASENSIQISWQWQTKDHKSVEMLNGTGLQVQIFDNKFDKKFR